MKIQFRYFYLIVLFLVVFLAFLYVVLRSLQTEANIFIGMVMVWAILLPVLSSFPYSLSYHVCLPSPMFGVWLMITALLEKYIVLPSYSIVATYALSLSLVYAFHILTRNRVMFWKFPIARLSRSSIAAVSVIFLAMGMFIVNPSSMNFDAATLVLYFVILLFGYTAASMLYVNSSYRLFKLGERLGVLNLDKRMSEIWTKLHEKFPLAEKDIELLEYYFNESLYGFLEGDYEKSFIWGYKVIREKTVVNPLEYVDDKRPNKQSFSEIRNTLEHSRRQGHVDSTKIRQMVGNLFNDCLDLLEREFEFMKKVSE